ncbi:MAG: hypothetical protein PHG55_01360 [Verrucomicrobiota bacterium]|nr:hypothetical protein [Verrucomicrobiota bacterium]
MTIVPHTHAAADWQAVAGGHFPQGTMPWGEVGGRLWLELWRWEG